MKRMGFALVCALLALGLTTAHLASAQPAARGSFRFLLEDGLLKSVDFNASTDPRGTTTGQLTFTDQAAIPDVDDPEDPAAGQPPPQLYVSASFDGLAVERNRALMSGTVRDSSHRTYIGKWVQLVVEDNGGGRIHDNLTWAFCKPPAGSWIPSDAEVPGDNGAYLSWWATDAERPDDVGIPSKSLLPGQQTACQAFSPLSLYSLVDLLRWDGRLAVYP